MVFMPFLFALGLGVAPQVTQPVLPVGSQTYCFIGEIQWPDGKKYDSVARLNQMTPEGLQIDVGKRYVHPALKTASDVWPYVTDAFGIHVNGPAYGDNNGDVFTHGNDAKFGTKISEAEKAAAAAILSTPGCAAKK